MRSVKKGVLAVSLMGAVAAVAMPTRQELVAAQKAVLDATAADVRATIALVQKTVYETSGVRLEPEVRIW